MNHADTYVNFVTVAIVFASRAFHFFTGLSSLLINTTCFGALMFVAPLLALLILITVSNRLAGTTIGITSPSAKWTCKPGSRLIGFIVLNPFASIIVYAVL